MKEGVLFIAWNMRLGCLKRVMANKLPLINLWEVRKGLLKLIGVRSECTEHLAISVTKSICQCRRSWRCSRIP